MVKNVFAWHSRATQRAGRAQEVTAESETREGKMLPSRVICIVAVQAASDASDSHPGSDRTGFTQVPYFLLHLNFP